MISAVAAGAGVMAAAAAWILLGLWADVRTRALIAWTAERRSAVRAGGRRSLGSVAAALCSGAATWTIAASAPGALVVAAAAAAAPWLAAREAEGRRRFEAARQLPEFLELLGLASAAGLALRQAWEAALRVLPPGRLRDLAGACAADLQMGRPWGPALEDMGRRLGDRRFDAAAALIRQAARRGAPLAAVLFQRAAHLRAEAMIAAEKRAQTAPLRLLFPLVFLIFPAIFLILLGPVFLSMARQGRIF